MGFSDPLNCDIFHVFVASGDFSRGLGGVRNFGGTDSIYFGPIFKG